MTEILHTSTKKATHTPRPWAWDAREADPGYHAAVVESTSAGSGVLYHEASWPVLEADAALIAAAPDLLAALKFALSDESGFACPSATEDRLRVAIAKAEGGAQ